MFLSSSQNDNDRFWWLDSDERGIPRGSKYQIFDVSGSKNHTLNGFWEPESFNIGYLDPLG